MYIKKQKQTHIYREQMSGYQWEVEGEDWARRDRELWRQAGIHKGEAELIRVSNNL